MTVLSDTNHFGSLNSLDSLTILVGKLPFELRRRWVERSVQTENYSGSLAKFSDFVGFVQVKSEEENSLFGLRTLSVKSPKPSSKVKVSSYNVTSTNSASKKTNQSLQLRNGICWFATAHHINFPDVISFWQPL